MKWTAEQREVARQRALTQWRDPAYAAKTRSSMQVEPLWWPLYLLIAGLDVGALCLIAVVVGWIFKALMLI